MFRVLEKNGGFLAMSPRPEGRGALAGAVRQWQSAGISTVVSLLESPEAAELGLAQEGGCCEAIGLEFTHYPVRDFGVPTDASSFHTLIQAIASRINQGNGVLVHCRGGIGRSGTVAVALLCHLGYALDEAVAHCSLERGVEVPETSAQYDWLVINCAAP